MSTTIVYLFGTERCPACRAFKPTFAAWAVRYGDRADFVYVSLDGAVPEALEQLRIASVPTVVVLKDDREIARFVGAPKELEITRLLGVTTSDQGDISQKPPSDQGG